MVKTGSPKAQEAILRGAECAFLPATGHIGQFVAGFRTPARMPGAADLQRHLQNLAAFKGDVKGRFHEAKATRRDEARTGPSKFNKLFLFAPRVAYYYGVNGEAWRRLY